jgi:septum formation protein
MLLLASNSPRRKQLLELGGWKFEIISVEIDERVREGERPSEYVRRLAKSKAQAAALHAPQEAIIIAADTTVVDEFSLQRDRQELILGKPEDAAEAEQMLRRLRGRTHQVYTAMAVLRASDGLLLQDTCVTDVTMRAYSDAEVQAYIDTGDPLDKAGAYAIQHVDFHPVAKVDGCYTNVVGLPLCYLARMLRELGVQPAQDLPQACMQALNVECPIFEQLLEK